MILHTHHLSATVGPGLLKSVLITSGGMKDHHVFQ